jgi:hypothetical protein
MRRWPPPELLCTCVHRFDRHAPGGGRCADCECDHFNVPPTVANVFRWLLARVQRRYDGA